MAEGLKFGRGTYQGAGKIGERDESFANRAAAAAPRDGWYIDTAAHLTNDNIAGGNPDTNNRTYFWPLPIYDRDYILTQGRTHAASAGVESQRTALYVLAGRELVQVPGTLITTTCASTGITKVDLALPATIQAGKRYFVGAAITTGTGQFSMVRRDGTAFEIPFLDTAMPPARVELFKLSKTTPVRLPYAVYLSKEAALVL